MSPRGPVLITAVNFRSGYKYGIVARSSPREDRIRSVFRALARSKVARARRTSIRLSTRVYGEPTLFTIFGNSRPLLPSKPTPLRSSPLFKDPPVSQRSPSVSDCGYRTAVYPSACSTVLKTCQHAEARVLLRKRA